tara:strand:- start:62 stop:268 length:207 start_codon:yes stop_codon:yes gene_type:complete
MEGKRNNRVRFGAGNSKPRAGGVKRLIFVNNDKTTLFNRYVLGSNVGSLNSSVRSALRRRASQKTCGC